MLSLNRKYSDVTPLYHNLNHPRKYLEIQVCMDTYQFQD